MCCLPSLLSTQAFSHFSYCYTQGQTLVCDIQGVDDLYTDPQIHSRDGKGWGHGNLGAQGMLKFFETHHCNAICKSATPFMPAVAPSYPFDFALVFPCGAALRCIVLRSIAPVVLCCVVLCCVVLCCVVLCCVVLCCVVLCCVVLCCVVLCCVVLCCVVLCCVVLCRRRCYQKAKGRDVYPRVKVNGLGCVCCVRAVRKCVVA